MGYSAQLSTSHGFYNPLLKSTFSPILKNVGLRRCNSTAVTFESLDTERLLLNQSSEKETCMTMKNNWLKFSIFLFFCAIFVSFGLRGSRVTANSAGPETRRTGAPGEQTCNASGCHAGSANNSGGGILTITGVPANYSPNQEVDITVTMVQAGRIRFGFEATVIDDQGRAAGTITVTEQTRTQLFSAPVGSNLHQYVMHSFGGTSPNGGSNQGRWTFRWKAPAQDVGRITFYAAANAANNNGSETGDLIYTTSVSTQPAPSVANIATVSAASFASNTTLAPDSIVAGFGSNLSVNIVSATTNPLPTQLDGTEIEIRDATSTDRKAGLFFVAPTQANYVIPAGSVNGPATVMVKRSGTVVAQGNITIESVSPGIFTANSGGTGVPAAQAFRVTAGGSQNYESIFTFQNGQPVATPIDLGPESDQVFLILYGTGFKNATPANFSVTVGGTLVPAAFAATAEFVGLDQCNVGPLPRSLIMRGNVDVVMTANGKTANTVTVNIK